MKPNISEITDIESFGIPQKNEEKKGIAFCAITAMIIMGVVTINLCLVIYGILLMLALNDAFEAWKEWIKTLTIFYILAQVTNALGIIAFLGILIVFGVGGSGGGVLIGIAGMVIYIVEIVLTIRAKNAVVGLYQIQNEQFKTNVPLGGP